MAEAYEEVILTENDLPTIVEELIEAQTKFYPLGTQLGVPVRKLETILMEHRNFSDCFINLIQEFLERGGATWRLIVKALRSKTVGMLALADKVEIAHIPHCFHESLDRSGADAVVRSKHLPSLQHAVPYNRPMPHDVSFTADSAEVREVEKNILNFHRRFNRIKLKTRERLGKCHIAVVNVVSLLTSILWLSEHKIYLEENIQVLRNSRNHVELFDKLNFYWTFLSFGLLAGLIDELADSNREFKSIKEKMDAYDRNIIEFRKSTALILFCKAARLPDRCEHPPNFSKLVTKHGLLNISTLEDAELFRRECFTELKLENCAVMIKSIVVGSFEVTLFVFADPLVIIENKEALFEVFRTYKVTSATFDGETIYPLPPSKLPQLPSPTPIVEAVLPEVKKPLLPIAIAVQRIKMQTRPLQATQESPEDAKFLLSEIKKLVSHCSALSDSVNKFGADTSQLMDECIKKVRSLTELDVDFGTEAITAFEDVREVPRVGLFFVGNVRDMFNEGIETDYIIQQNRDIQQLLGRIRGCINKAYETYDHFEHCFNRARESCLTASVEFMSRAKNKNIKKKIAGGIGGTTTAAATTVVVGGIIASVVTGGLAAPFFIAGGAVAAVSSIGVTAAFIYKYYKAETIFKECATMFDNLWLANRETKAEVDKIRKMVLAIESSLQNIKGEHISRRTTGNALDELKRGFQGYRMTLNLQHDRLNSRAMVLGQIVDPVLCK